MKTINLKKENGMLVVSTPYNSEFVNRAKNLGGRWDAKNSTWVFDESVEDYVKQTLLDIFGVTGEASYETCSLIVRNFTKNAKKSGVELFSRIIARAFGRDTGAKLGDGIVWIDGTKVSDGSYQNWNTYIENATFEIQDFPIERTKFEDVQKAVSEGWCEIKIVKKQRTREEIEAEIANLKNRISELEHELSNC